MHWPLQRPLALLLAFVQVAWPALAAAQSIVTDGRTQTSVNATGNVVNVTTGTVTGANAFNSFSKFGVAQGVTANLFLPSGAANLINIVRDQRTDIYGILNSIKDGRIGGNVWFANPYGFVVGASGVVNVGSLTVSTPTAAFVDGFFLAPGSPNPASVTQLLQGTAPRSAGALVSIQGRVNATEGVMLSAGAINVAGSIFSGARFIGSAPDFTDVVNANGVASATNVVVKEGRIRIVADNDVTVSGTIAAPGGAGVRGGDIGITAGGNVELAAGAGISARGNGANSAGGSISVYGNTAAFRSGATIDASAGSSGDGGAIELSAADKVTLAGGAFAAGAQQGRAGSVLVDPNSIEVVSSNQIVSGANFTLAANNSIAVNSGVTISTRSVGSTNFDNAASTGNSGDITLIAPSIALDTGSKLLAHTEPASSFQGGAVTLSATQTAGGTSQINLSQATVKGKSVSLQATSTLTNTSPGALVLSGVNSSEAAANIVVDSSQIAASGGTLSIGSTSSVSVSATGTIPLAVLRASSSATVNVKGSSSLTTTAGAAQLSATSTVATTATPTSPLANQVGDAMVATSDVNSTATVHIGDLATANIAGTLGLAAANNVTTTQIANASAAGNSAAGAVVALSLISSTTSATVDGQANIAGASALNLSALSRNAATVTAKSAAQGASEDAGGGSKSSQALAKYKDSTNTGDSGSSGSGVKVAGAVAVMMARERWAAPGPPASQTPTRRT